MNLDLPKPVKSFVAPVWIMAVSCLSRIYFAVIAMKAYVNYQERYGGRTPINKWNLIIIWFFVVLAAAEAVLYWLIRKKNYNKRWVWTHLVLMMLSMIITPFLFIVFVRVARDFMSANHFVKILGTISIVRFYFFWICFIIGNTFFIQNIRKSLQPVAESVEDMVDAIGTG